MDVEFQTNANPISSATKSEPSDNHASYSSGNGYKATPVMNNVISIILCIHLFQICLLSPLIFTE